jgi:hypothetical protein
MLLFWLEDAMTALKRLDEFFAEEEVEPSARYELPNNSDETVVVVSKSAYYNL